MPVAAKVNAFQTEVGCDQGLLSSQRAQHGAIVSNSGKDAKGRRGSGKGRADRTPTGRRFRHPANLGYQRFFGERHAQLL
jgi:hypothetical protein